MPLYEYKCPCGATFDFYYSMQDDSSHAQCACGLIASKQFTIPSLKTDTSFFATGTYDDRLCENRNDVIQGRKDWDRRLEKKNLTVIDKTFLESSPPKPEPSF